MLSKLFVNLPYGNDKPDIIEYLFNESVSNYTQYFSFIMSSHYYTTGNPWGTAEVLLNPLRNKTIQSTSGAWCSLSKPNSFLILKLNKIAMKITNYIIGQNFRSSEYLFSSWLVEGSMNGKKWFYLDSKSTTESSFFTRGGIISSSTEKHFIRYIKFTQINKDSSESDHFIIGTLKLFGEVYFYSNVFTCSKQIKIPKHFLFIFILKL